MNEESRTEDVADLITATQMFQTNSKGFHGRS